MQLYYVHAAFEAAVRPYDPFEEALSEAESWQVRAPILEDSLEGREYPATWETYRARGTPWTVVIDRRGTVRFSGFTPSFAFQEALVEALLRE